MRPLKGKSILVTRARHQAHALTHALEQQGAEVIAIPSIEMVPPDSYDALDAAIRELHHYHWLVLTSANGVEAFFARWQRQARQMLGEVVSAGEVRVAAMGPATARALEAHGISVDLIPEQYVAESLVEALRDQVFGKDVLLVRARVARDVVPEGLAQAGARVHVVDAYQTVVPESSCEALRNLLADGGGAPDAATFTSASTVTNFFRLLQAGGVGAWPPGMAAASIGPVTSRTLLEYGIEPVVEAAEFTIPGLVSALCRWAEREHEF